MKVFFDTETTAKDNGRLVQLAMKSDEKPSGVNLFFKPAEPITIEAMAVHHITEEQVAGLPTFDSDPRIREAVQECFSGDNIAVAHNAKFDIAVMEREGVKIGRYIDTLRVAQHLLPEMPCFQLQYLRYALKLDRECVGAAAHDAMGDVIVLEALFRTLYPFAVAKVKESKAGAGDGMASVEEVDAYLIELSQKPVLMKALPFGKYAGKSFEEVVRTDRGYLVWLKDRPDLSEDLAFTVNHFLKA